MNDSRGLAVSTENPKSLEIYETALRALNSYRGDPVAIIDTALEAQPDFAMGHILRAAVHVTMWEQSVVSPIQDSLAKLSELEGRMNERERQHVGAIRTWVSGDWDGLRSHYDRLLADYPRDTLALQVAHLADFYHGDHDNLRGRIARVLPAWNRNDPGYGFVLGMFAFGLEESNNYPQAEETGRHAVEVEPEDCWAQHAVAHVLEMQARQEEGIAFMNARKAYWAQDDNAFAFHNWWHTALYHLDQGQVDRVLEIYDQGVRPAPEEVQLTLVDAASLLWRLHLLGIDVGGRWDEVVATYQKCDEKGFYAYNDVHAVMAYVATGKMDAAAAQIAAVERAVAAEGTNAQMSREVGLPIARAIEAFGREDYRAATDLLMPVRHKAYVFGGSNAQRDFVHRTVIESALRAGDHALATSLLNERTTLKPHCPFSRKLFQRASA